jgi:NAD-dependent deacetylase
MTSTRQSLYQMSALMSAKSTFDIPSKLITTLRAASNVTVLTGAGISAESGIPTFRDAQTGLWSQYRPEDLSTPQAFHNDPRLVWEWHAWLGERIAQADPNPGHLALVDLERHVPKLTLVTQNVDGLHQRAGSRNVTELHGNIARTRCVAENIVVESQIETSELPPRCPHCGGLLRPDLVWFGELLPEDALQLARDAARSCDLFFSIGTSGEVEPAASLLSQALRRGATIVIVNPAMTPSSSQKFYVLSGPSGQVLPALVRAAWPDP